MNKAKNLKNKRFGKWTVKGRRGKDKIGNSLWECECDCGHVGIVRASALKSGKSTQCKECTNTVLWEGNKKDDFHVASGTVYQQVKSNAKARGLKCSITKDDVKKFMSMNCHYCGALPSNIVSTFAGRFDPERAVNYNGIDRIDNSLGYILDNCVPCCKQCNWAKRDLTSEQFFTWIRSVYLNTKNRATDKTVGMLIDQLGTTLLKCWFAQEKVMSASTPEERAKAGEAAQITNARRNELIRALDEYFGNTATELPKTYA